MNCPNCETGELKITGKLKDNDRLSVKCVCTQCYTVYIVRVGGNKGRQSIKREVTK